MPARRKTRQSTRKRSVRESESFSERLDQTVIAMPLLDILREEGARKPQYVVIDLNLLYPGGRDNARKRAKRAIKGIVGTKAGSEPRGVDEKKSELSTQYLFARLTGREIRELVDGDDGRLTGESARAIYKIWPDFEIKPLLTRSVSTIKADAARVAFSAGGRWIGWAVMDSGIDGKHLHFNTHHNLDLEPPLRHMDFTTPRIQELDVPEDHHGHGTHVAGIIAGEVPEGASNVRAVTRLRDEGGDVTYRTSTLSSIAGVAPECTLVSLKVLDDDGFGRVSSLIAAIGYVQKVNDHGRMLRIHGVNMSLGYEFNAEWFACGQSPLCVEVDRLVRSGVVVVVAAGNSGYGFAQTQATGTVSVGLDLTINDPGNADLAITVGATHAESPHVYGVSYFSSKGPTGDGRLKPDLVAPGEKVVSCAAGTQKRDVEKKSGGQCDYREESGTSMAAPHVSGAIAAFLSIRREFRGQPERVKEIFLSTATDLKRERYFQGHGLIDLMRAIQSV